MSDIFSVIVVIVFFAISSAFARGCEKLLKEE